MEIKGKVIQSLGVEGGTSKAGKEWHRASLLVEVSENPQYPKKVKISNMKNYDAFSKIPVGSFVTFQVEIESREFNERWYTDVTCWKWEALQGQQPQPYAQPQQAYQQPMQGYPQQQYPQQGGQAFYGPAPSYPVNPQSATPTLDSMGVQGYQQPQQTQPTPQGEDDLPF